MADYQDFDNTFHDVFSGDLPRIGLNKESKFQHLMQQHNPRNPTSSTMNNFTGYSNGPYPTMRMNLSVEAKAFQPVKGQQRMLPPDNQLNNIFPMSMPDAERINPTAREFVPQARMNGGIGQQPQPQQANMPKHLQYLPDFTPAMKATRPAAGDMPFYPPPTNQFPSLTSAAPPGTRTNDANVSVQSGARNQQQQQQMQSNSVMCDYLPSLNNQDMERHRLSTAAYPNLSTNSSSHNGHYFTDSTPTGSLNGGYVPSPGAQPPYGAQSQRSMRAAAGYMPADNQQQQQQQQLMSSALAPSFSTTQAAPITAVPGRAASPNPVSRKMVPSSPAVNSRGGGGSSVQNNASMASSNNAHQEPSDIGLSGDERGAAAAGAAGGHKPYETYRGGCTYFSASHVQPGAHSNSMQFQHVYPGTPAAIEYMPKKPVQSYFMRDSLRSELAARHQMTMMTQEDDGGLPREIDNYNHLMPIQLGKRSAIFCNVTSCFKAFKNQDGKAYFLRRVHGFCNIGEKTLQIVEMWKKHHHPFVVQLREAFTTKIFSDISIMFVHDYYPTTETLYSYYFGSGPAQASPFVGKNKWNNGGGVVGARHTGVINEKLLWSYIIQLTSALRSVHSAGLACRTIDLTKIIMINKLRIRISGVGVLDVVDSSTGSPSAQHQQEDLIALGKVILALACKSLTPQLANLPTVYSNDMRNFLLYLLANQNGRLLKVNEMMPFIGARFYDEIENVLLASDNFESELGKEMGNGRLVRLVTKLNLITERPSFDGDARWSETGDRYLIKLFRDYVYHAVDENGAPFIDMAHVVQSLNKLDYGSSERIQLVSRCGQNLLIVSYEEIRALIAKCYAELQAAAAAPSPSSSNSSAVTSSR